MTLKSLDSISLLSLLFGTGSWIAITGLWMEMPLLISRLPEGWALASYINVMINLANIGPLIYWLVRRLKVVNEISATHVQMILGIVSCAALIFLWDNTFHVFGSLHSVWLFVGTFGLALVDCTSSVTFLPFMARFDSSYLTPYLVGEGLSGFIPSMVALAQGVGEARQNECVDTATIAAQTNQTYENQANIVMVKPRFSVEVFFLSLLVTVMVSYLAFICLQYLPNCKQEMENVKLNKLSQNRKQTVTMLPGELNPDKGYDLENKISLVHGFVNDQDLKPQTVDINKNFKQPNQQNQSTYYYLLCQMCWNCFTTFGFMPSIQPYSALPYGEDILHYVVILAGLAYPAGCFFGMLVEKKSVQLINLLTILGTVVGLYILVCSLMSPMPPLVGQTSGGILIIVAWITFVGTLSYAKTMATLWICDYNSDQGLFWVGMHTQFGAAFGSALIFVLINHTKYFNECL